MIAFASNSLLARMGLGAAADGLPVADPGLFTTVRIVSGAATLWVFVALANRHRTPTDTDWAAAAALFVYAAGFSYAYVTLSAATGALLLFATVQVSLLSWGWWQKQTVTPMQGLGIGLGLAGIVLLMLPGATAPNGPGSVLMVAAGLAWAVYTLRGGRGDPVLASRNNFVQASLLCIPLLLYLGFGAFHSQSTSVEAFIMSSMPPLSLLCALLSGVAASAGGYILWYRVLVELNAIDAATVQLSVPVLTALAGIVLLDEPLTLRISLAFVISIAGIALAIRYAPDRQ